MRRELSVRSVLCKAPEVPVFGKIGLTLSFPRNPYFPNCIFLKEATGFSQKGEKIRHFSLIATNWLLGSA